MKLAAITMPLTFVVTVSLLGFIPCAALAQDAAYPKLVKSLEPTYYYRLNETDPATGAVDEMGNGPLGVYNGNYANRRAEVGATGPDSLIEEGRWTDQAQAWGEVGKQVEIVGLGADNVAHASNDQGHITLGDGATFASNAISVAMFASGGPSQGGDRLFTNNQRDPLTSFQIVVGLDGLAISTNPNVPCDDVNTCGQRTLYFPGEGIELTSTGADRGLNDSGNGWWHIVATTEGDTAEQRTENIRLWLNGVDRSDDLLPGTVGYGVDPGQAKIGGRRADPFDSTTHSGAQDEVAIWLGRALTSDEALGLYDAAVVPEPSSLVLALSTLLMGPSWRRRRVEVKNGVRQARLR